VLTDLGAVWAWGTYRDASGVMGFSKHTRIQVRALFCKWDMQFSATLELSAAAWRLFQAGGSGAW